MSGKSSEGASPSSAGASVPRAASSLIQPRQTKRGAQFEAPCLLFPRDLDGGLEGLFSWCWIGRFTHRQDFTFHAAQSGSKRILPCVFDINEPCSESQERLQDVRMRPRLEPGKPQRVAQTKIFPVGASVVCPCAIPRCLLPHLLRASAPILEKRCPMSLRGAFHVPDPTPAQLLNATMTNGNRRAKRVARRLSHIRARANAVFVAAGAGPLAWRFAVA